jgi:hypothetical protein
MDFGLARLASAAAVNGPSPLSKGGLAACPAGGELPTGGGVFPLASGLAGLLVSSGAAGEGAPWWARPLGGPGPGPAGLARDLNLQHGVGLAVQRGDPAQAGLTAWIGGRLALPIKRNVLSGTALSRWSRPALIAASGPNQVNRLIGRALEPRRRTAMARSDQRLTGQQPWVGPVRVDGRQRVRVGQRGAGRFHRRPSVGHIRLTRLGPRALLAEPRATALRTVRGRDGVGGTETRAERGALGGGSPRAAPVDPALRLFAQPASGLNGWPVS